MSDLISREKALEALYAARVYVNGLRSGKTLLTEYGTQLRKALVGAVEKVDRADAEYVRHGAWIVVGKTPGGARILKCSHCGIERKGIGKSAYCRDCGAKMDLLNLSDEALDALAKLDRGVHNYVIDEAGDAVVREPEPMWPKESPYLKKGGK